MEKQKLLYQQARLHDRGAAEMVLQTISASKGQKATRRPQKLMRVYGDHGLTGMCVLCRRDGADGGLHAQAGNRHTQRRKLHSSAGTMFLSFCFVAGLLVVVVCWCGVCPASPSL